ncbi:hypothetical protein QBC45DRAFT_392065 [Copromyces sp. CBS 386.78]|nr:hypothetical protein QBC45DRAFT_392065 [Copromyces sp. CBS 386.78]
MRREMRQGEEVEAEAGGRGTVLWESSFDAPSPSRAQNHFGFNPGEINNSPFFGVEEFEDFGGGYRNAGFAFQAYRIESQPVEGSLLEPANPQE